MGYLFNGLGPEEGFYYTLIPIVALFVALVFIAAFDSEKSVDPMKNNLPPSRIFPALFETLHASGLWPDGKMLSDAVPLATPDEIVSAFQEEKQQVDFDLKAFFERYFQPNPSRSVDFESDLTLSIEAHIERLWPVLTRAKDPHIEGSSLLPLPYEYIVPGGRFNEIYYWDSYFTQLGLVQSGRVSMVASMVANFAFLIDEVGFIPNGNRELFFGTFTTAILQLDGSALGQPKRASNATSVSNATRKRIHLLDAWP